MMRHWPVMFFAIIVALIFLVSVFSFQAPTTEWVLVETLGKIESDSIKGGDSNAGLKFRWPHPIQKIIRYDRRSRCFEGSIGKEDETLTKDGRNVILGIYVVYNIEKPVKFYEELQTVSEAEKMLNSRMRTVKTGVIGKYDLSELINTDPKNMKLSEVEKLMFDDLSAQASKDFGIKVSSLGIRSIGIPEDNTKKVFERMIEDRKRVAQKYRSEGEKLASGIRAEAESKSKQIVAQAEAKARKIKAEGDAAKAEYYKVFKENPELAAFLKKIESLQKIMKTQTTLVLDTNSAPFDLFKMNEEKLGEIDKKAGK